jgi:hypothetical protein
MSLVFDRIKVTDAEVVTAIANNRRWSNT